MDGMCSACGGTEKSVQNIDRNYVRKRPFCRTNITGKDNTKTDFEEKNYSL